MNKSTSNLLLQAGKNEKFRSESKKKAFFNGISFDIGNVGLVNIRIGSSDLTSVGYTAA
jgi:hypothetical protein